MAHSHPHDHDHGHHGHAHNHTHSHGPATPHPAQAAPWSILRMTVLARLCAALAVSAGLWAVVLVAMR
jgi:ABC-type Zn2+ transport system substrate-binding protein/surface adhesin